MDLLAAVYYFHNDRSMVITTPDHVLEREKKDSDAVSKKIIDSFDSYE